MLSFLHENRPSEEIRDGIHVATNATTGVEKKGGGKEESKIKEGRKDGRTEGRKEGRKDGREEGRKEGRDRVILRGEDCVKK
jgi:flagellar biosynthesis/type III secretory pathway protein FliH